MKWPLSSIYEVFVRSFADGNEDGIGDLPGLRDQLDYIVGLGCDALWLTPFHPSPSYHKYDVTNYFDVDPEYGSIADFEDLIKEAHEKDLKVIMDLVVNHCSREHLWFQSALKGDPEFRNYFIWKPKNAFKSKKQRRKGKSGDSDNTVIWHEIDGHSDLFYAYFWEGMPNLNYDNPAVRNQVFEIGRFWLEKGVDGFRLDAAMHLYPDDQVDDTVAFWTEFKKEMQQVNPKVFLLGEVWKDLETQSKFKECFSSLFSFDLSYSILESVKRGLIASAHVSKDAWKAEDRGSPAEIYNEGIAPNPGFIQSTFLSNHDQERVVSFLKNNIHKAKLAASILLTLPGIPVVYYGEEIGLKGKKPDEYLREPYPWCNQYQTDWMQPKYNKQPKPEVAALLKDHYKTLLKFRNQYPEWAGSEVVPIDLKDPELFAFQIPMVDEELQIIHNLSDEAKPLELPYGMTPIFYTCGLENMEINEFFTIQSYSSIIFKPNTP
ncbi:alpha-amylase family glycosyl hydrolase [Marinoscillum sp. MHG1-6]|uniref:alpha-amylase family glycosyl hydrolase n=1 Tax=Marinoscillum sp. MHG1-6 TaxID=2959627 RepID=UPI002157B400|nr:alpha-amylase family glycosyl hydrolase [Marinoscillum sp. MHG1-6]